MSINMTPGGIIIPFPTETIENKTIEVVHNGIAQEVTIPWWVTSPEREIEKKKLLMGQFFILRQGELGEIFRCKNCKGKHTYYTLMCVERPFDGLRQGLLAYYHNIGLAGGEKYLSTLEYQRYQEISKKVGGRNLADGHPQLARSIGTEANDYDIGALSLGLLEPITKRKAEVLAWNINLKGIKPEFRLEGLEKNGKV